MPIVALLTTLMSFCRAKQLAKALELPEASKEPSTKQGVMSTNQGTGFQTSNMQGQPAGGGNDIAGLLAKISGPVSVIALIMAFLALVIGFASGGGVDPSRVEKLEGDVQRMTEEITRQNTRIDTLQADMTRLNTANTVKIAPEKPKTAVKAKAAPAKKGKAAPKKQKPKR